MSGRPHLLLGERGTTLLREGFSRRSALKVLTGIAFAIAALLVPELEVFAHNCCCNSQGKPYCCDCTWIRESCTFWVTCPQGNNYRVKWWAECHGVFGCTYNCLPVCTGPYYHCTPACVPYCNPCSTFPRYCPSG